MNTRKAMDCAEMLYITACLVWCVTLASVARSAVPNPPTNLSLTEILSNTAVVTWDIDTTEKITVFEMTVRPLGDKLRIFKARLDGTRRSFMVDSLFPETEYELSLAAQNLDGMSNTSDIITFRTLEASEGAYLQRPDIHPGEVLIVGLILIAWFCAIALFLHKWGKLRILQNDQPRFNHSPKNIETIKVVKRPTDSVIYKNYSSQYSKTMVAREKRLARMNTMPNIKVNIKDLNDSPIKEETKGKEKSEDGANNDASNDNKQNKAEKKAEKHKYKIFSRTITSPVLEVEEPSSTNA